MYKLLLLFCIFNYASPLYRQNSYQVNIHHLEKNYYNSDFIRNWNVIYAPYNRTVRVFNFYGHILKKLSQPHLKIVCQVYMKIVNEYRIFAPIRMQVNLCQAYKKNLFGIGIIHTLSNVSYCPINPGYYQGKNFYLDDTLFPPNVPAGEYSIKISFTYGETAILEFTVYYEIKYKIKGFR